MQVSAPFGCTPKGPRQHTLLRRVLRRGFSEGGVLKKFLVVRFSGAKGLQKRLSEEGFQKVLRTPGWRV